jgi:hypothetical protein
MLPDIKENEQEEENQVYYKTKADRKAGIDVPDFTGINKKYIKLYCKVFYDFDGGY